MAFFHTDRVDFEDRDYEFNAREDYISELAFEHFDPCAGHEEEDLIIPHIPEIRGDAPWEEDDIEF